MENLEKIALFPGSFDPITNAHLDILYRALPLFDRIVIAVGMNSAKKAYIELDQRIQVLEHIFKNQPKISVSSYEGLTVSYCKETGAQFILRGIRNQIDFNFEQAIAQNNLLLDDHIETIFLTSSPGYTHISSTIVRDIHRNGGNIAHLVPAEIPPILPRPPVRP